MQITIPAINDSARVIIMTLEPVSRSTSFLKKRPTPKAIKASAKSLTKPMFLITPGGMALSTQGPIIMPANMYPLTFGNFIILLKRVNKNPENKMIARTVKTTVD